MIRTLSRLAIILLVTGAVAGALYFIVTPGAPSSNRAPARGSEQAPDRARPAGEPETADASHGGRGGPWSRRDHQGWTGRERPGRDGHGERGGHDEASWGRGLAGAAGTAMQLGVVLGGTVLVQRGLRRQKRPATDRTGEAPQPRG